MGKECEVTPMLLKGEPVEGIVNATRTLNPELPAFGAKGLTGVDSFLLGGVAQRVAIFSRYSVLVGRAPGRQQLP